ncbi:FxSxx-COOH system tetratricopeptide repeat protein [Plantactinospora endophytica]|uniref:FxSxx-COOH system tetratricopeptide repeat protein n=1 Tax=Plantactinospora endophytica TaxID=673535 RepID=UPI0023B24941|nr:FxSxx-COOH system tetratricopeptide repeat protein [Plantactinospora endophytica]
MQFMNALPDRRLLINLVRRDVINFPDVQERPEARLHVVEIVLACLGNPGGLRALVAALSTMAPDAPGTKRATQLIESAALLNLLPDSEVKRIHELLRRAEDGRPDPGWWRPTVSTSAPRLPGTVRNLTAAFDHLATQPIGQHRVPAALALVSDVAAQLDGPIAVELSHWAEGHAERLELLEEFRALRRQPDDSAEEAAVVAASAGPADGPAIPHQSEAPPEEADDSVGEDPQGTGQIDTISASSPAGSDRLVEIGPTDVADLPVQSESDAGLLRGDPMPPVAPTQRSTAKLPQVWGDVPQRNPNFTGRKELLEHLHNELQTSRETAVLPQALHGMGGVGKSQVAIEYVHQHSGDYDLVWWVPSEQDGQILASLTKLAQRLDLEVSPEANSAVPAVREALSTGQVPYDSWLLVFDNAETPDEVQKYFPTGGAGKILVTSRDLDWARVSQAIEVDVFTREESRTFLRKRNPELSDADTDRLAEALGDLPLAIEQAAAWRAATGMPVDEYLALLEDKRIELLDASPSPDYKRSVAAAWKLSLERLKEVNESAFQLLQICSFFAPEPISRDLFAGSPTAPITPALDTTLSDKFRLSRAIRDIQRYALARIDHRRNTLQIHRLIQAVLVGEMGDDERELMRRGAHTLLANGNPNNPSRRERWENYLALRPHVAVSRAVESTDPRVQDLVFGIVQFLYHWGDHTGSEELAEEAYGLWVRHRGETAPQTLRLAKWLGWTRWINGKYREARELNQHTLELYRQTLGEEDEGTIDAMYMVSIDLRTSGDFTAARELDEQALAIARREFGDDDFATLVCASSLGVSLRLNGEFARAAKLDRDTADRRATLLGSDDEATLNTLNGLCIDMRESGSYLEARRQQEELYARHLTAFGPDAPATLRAARTLAVARRKAGDHSGALSLAETTLEKYRRRYDDDYPDTIATAVNFAIDLRHTGDLAGALELGEATLERYGRMFGPHHSYTLSARTNLAIVLRLQGDVEAAYRHNKEALELLHSTLGDDHPVTLICATNLASDLYALGKVQEAYEQDTDTLARSERTLGVEHPSTLACSVNLALDLRALGRVNEADKILADTMARLRRVLGDRHPATLNAIQNVRADCDVDPMPL